MPVKFFGTLSVSPSSGAAGATITILNTGAGFFGTMIVRDTDAVGAAYDNIAIDATYGNGQQKITCDVPAGLTAGVGVIYIENPDGESKTIAFTVIPAAPSITSVSPDTASTAGGETIEINGAFEDFAGSTVDYGGTAAVITAAAADKITITAPAHAAGAIIITVTDSYAQSDTAAFDVANPSTAVGATHCALGCMI